MKQPKKLTRSHKEYLRRCRLDPNNWMLLSEDKDKYVYIHKQTNQTRIRTKGVQKTWKSNLENEEL